MARQFDAYSHKRFSNDPTLHGALPIMRAKVVYNNDPKKIGRIKVRIPSYHGVPGMTDKFIEDEDLPWAMPCFYGGCGQDLGSFIVPIPGTFVWVMFENNDVETPVYLGGVPSIGSGNVRLCNNINDPESPQEPWLAKTYEPDIPHDEFEGKSTGVPERHILYKSQKGHTIMCDDTDGEESMTFLDRVGQLIKFVSPVSKEQNKGRYSRRLKSAEKDSQLGLGLKHESHIMMRSGEVEDHNKLHSMTKMYPTHMRGECIDADDDKFTTTDYSPYEYNQQTQNSILNMTEDHIYISFPEILQYFCADYWFLKAFDKCFIECTPDRMQFMYDGNGLYIDGEGLKLYYKGTVLTETPEEFDVVAEKSFKMSAAGTTLSGDEDSFSTNSKEVKMEGSGSIYTEGGKTYMSGTEIHFEQG